MNCLNPFDEVWHWNLKEVSLAHLDYPIILEIKKKYVYLLKSFRFHEKKTTKLLPQFAPIEEIYNRKC